MSRISRMLPVAFAVLLALAGSTAGAMDVPPTVTQAELDGALAARHDQQSADRERVKALLQREDLQALAGEQGIDLQRAERAVDTLESAELQSLAAQAAAFDAALQGGDAYIHISLIALLLIVIIVILLAD